ncbi:efflux RND transporter permease subunit [Motiliproteus sp. MSK22-1]|uniref:efflux RND transporter permease subunit n=1 Tax=Motiliproteus sp. MSK22-1 TaxID=1897630 RepID=UPI000976EEFE|nr:efflux RND transporter permease subunit [Motiliproteus sp. MSK22-1]OMH25944.1 acriflavin resistance protein [Motiliproteus sp. MSK22-1]
MGTLIDAALDRSRTVLLVLFFLLVAGIFAFITIPKESDPDIAIPIIYVSISHEGIAPEDAERLLVRPMEKELRNIEGIKEMRSVANEGHASVTLEFDAGFDAKQALLDVREKVDIAKSELPESTDEPSVHEVNVGLFPVMTLSLSGPVGERQLVQIARNLEDEIEALPNVLKVDIGGDREEVLEVLVDPLVLESYNIDYQTIFDIVGRNNQLVAAGAMDTGSGRLVLKVPGVIEELDDMLNLPVKIHGSTVITFADVATLRSTFKDPEGFARVDGQPAIALEISKRTGANIIDTIEQVRTIVSAAKQQLPKELRFTYILDKSEQIRNMLKDLLNNILSAIVLVMVIIIAALGFRSSLLVGLAIPGSFLTGLLCIYALGMTLNVVVLFSLILVVGMLVDGAIVVVELADRRLNEGLPAKEAFSHAAQRMAWPVIASTATTLAVFMPLVFWPGVVGEFMKFLPITVTICLLASLSMALIFLPVVGRLLNRKRNLGTLAPINDPVLTDSSPENDSLPIKKTGRGSLAYLWLLERLIRHPAKTLLFTLAIIAGTYYAYSLFGHGVEFFPDVEPETAQIHVHARGDLSIHEKDRLLQQVENRIAGMDELRATYARSFSQASNNTAEDVIGVIQFQFIDWHERRRAKDILNEMRVLTNGIPGVYLEFRKEDSGPSGGKPIQLQISGRDGDQINQLAQEIRDLMVELKGFADSEDNRSLPGIEWRLEVNREEAARYGADIALLGNAVQMLTAGIKVTEYRPDYTDDEVDIRVRFPINERKLDQLDQLRVKTNKGMVAISNFMELVPAPKTGSLNRVDGRRVITIQSDVEEGLLVNDKLLELQTALKAMTIPEGIKLNFKGEDADQKETGQFLITAFTIALFVMLLILVTQFNSIYQSLLILSAILFSTAGVLIGLMITGQPFGIVMVGIGIIALAGIVVNNNIVLIDTYNRFRNDGDEVMEAALRTGALRLRPVLLTAITTVLGLVPMVFALNIDLINRQIDLGAPSTQWWTQLASAIAGGLSFATLLTLLLTPCMLVLGERLFGAKKTNSDSKPVPNLTSPSENL